MTFRIPIPLGRTRSKSLSATSAICRRRSSAKSCLATFAVCTISMRQSCRAWRKRPPSHHFLLTTKGTKLEEKLFSPHFVPEACPERCRRVFLVVKLMTEYFLENFIEDLERITRTEASQEKIIAAAKPLLERLVRQPH